MNILDGKIINANDGLNRKLMKSFKKLAIDMYGNDIRKSIVFNFLESDLEDTSYIFLYVIRNKVVGCVYLRKQDYVFEKFFDNGVYEISNLFVLENYRHLGIATQLLQKCEQIAKDNGVHTIASGFFDFNTASKNLHLKNGFTPFKTEIHVIKHI